MNAYEKLKAYFRPSEYIPTRVECRHCESYVAFGETHCPECDNMLLWCEAKVTKKNGTLKVMV